MIYPWQYELLERKVEHNLWSKEQTCFCLEMGRNESTDLRWFITNAPKKSCEFSLIYAPPYDPSFYLLCYKPGFLHASCELALQSCCCSCLWLRTSYRGPTTVDKLKVKLKACHGWGEAPLIVHHPPQATTLRLLENLGIKMWTVPKNDFFFFFADRTSLLFGPCAKISCKKFSEDVEFMKGGLRPRDQLAR